MHRIALCEDENVICSELEKYIMQACNDLHIESEIDIFSSGSILEPVHIKLLQFDNKYVIMNT